jgi:hypothetical protein
MITVLHDVAKRQIFDFTQVPTSEGDKVPAVAEFNSSSTAENSEVAIALAWD